MEYFAFQWHITDECDQRCKHCYIFAEDACRKPDAMTWPQIQDTFYNCLDFCQVYCRVPYFYLTGGDPILHRRAIRRFEPEQIGEETLQQILQAGLYAPSAGGRQGVLLVVSQDRAVNERLGRIKRANSHPRMATATSYVSREQPSIADDPKLTDAFYNAPTVITLFAPKDFLFAAEDCATAAENMMLAADSLGVGSCYIGQGWTAFADPYGQEVLRQWHIPGDHYSVAQVLLGYPRRGDPHPTPKPRKEGRILRV